MRSIDRKEFLWLSLIHIFGYKGYQTPEALGEAVRKLYETQIIPARKAGLAADVYTQLSDCLLYTSTYKRVTLQRTAPEGHISTYSPHGTGNVIIQAIDFDGGNVEATTPFVQASISTARCV